MKECTSVTSCHLRSSLNNSTECKRSRAFAMTHSRITLPQAKNTNRQGEKDDFQRKQNTEMQNYR